MLRKTLYESPFGLRLLYDEEKNYWFFENGPAGSVTGAVILPVDNLQNVILLEIDRVPIASRSLELPRGGTNAGENPLQTATRELQEETGLLMEPDKLFLLGNVHPDAGVMNSEVAIFTALYDKSFLEAERLPHCNEEHLGMHILPIEQVKNLIAQGRITDSFTISAIALFMLCGPQQS
jgi:ADP-ribose pyrophosphatase